MSILAAEETPSYKIYNILSLMKMQLFMHNLQLPSAKGSETQTSKYKLLRQ